MRRYLLHTLKTRLRAGRSLYLLTVFGVALGVASVLSVQIINLSAVAAFRGALRAVGSEADLTIRGRNQTLKETLFPEVLGTRDVRGAWPVYRLDVAVKGSDSLLLEVMGIDLLSPASRESLELLGREKASESLTQPGWMAVTPELARAQGWSVGDSIEVSCGPREARLVVGALVDFARVTTLAGAKLAVMDISQVQGLLGRPGELHEIHVEAGAEDRAGLQALLEKRLGPSVEVLTPAQREDEAAGLLSAFRLNLTALSLISLFVGSFVVYTSSQALLVRRRREFGVLRAVGATRAQLLGLIAFEAALVGALGVLLGTGLGYWAARANVDAVSATLTQVYLLNEITSLQVPAWVYLAGAAAGMGAALAGTLLPALDLCLSPPRSLLSSRLLQERVRTSAIPLALAGTGILALAAVWYWFAADWRPAGFVLGVALLVAIPLFTPLLVRAASLLPLSGLGVGFGVRSLAGRWTTTVFTASSLAIAVSMMVGVTLKTSSFRETLEVWLRTSVQADIYVKTESWRGRGDEAALSPELVSRLSRAENIVAFDRYRRLTVRSGDERIFLAGVETGLPGGEARFPVAAGDPDAVYRQFRDQGAALVGETLARRRGLEPGGVLPLVTPAGQGAGAHRRHLLRLSAWNGAGRGRAGDHGETLRSGPCPKHGLLLETRSGYRQDHRPPPGGARGRVPAVPQQPEAAPGGDGDLRPDLCRHPPAAGNQPADRRRGDHIDAAGAGPGRVRGTRPLPVPRRPTVSALQDLPGQGSGNGRRRTRPGSGRWGPPGGHPGLRHQSGLLRVDHPGPLALGDRAGPVGDHPGGGGAGEPLSGAGGQPDAGDSTQPGGPLRCHSLPAPWLF